MTKPLTLKFRFFSVAILTLFMWSKAAHSYDKDDLIRFQQTGSCVACDLSGVDLHNQNLSGVMLQRSNLTNANLSNCNLKKANLSWTYLMKANLTGADLTGGTLRGAYLSNADLSAANLSDVDLWGSTYYYAKLNNVKGLDNNPTK